MFLTATPESKRNLEFDMEIRVLLKGMSEDGFNEYLVIDKRIEKEIDCAKGDCSSFMIFYAPYLDYTVYDLSLEVYQNITADDIRFDLGYITSKFTKFQLITKYAFFAIATFSMIYYLYQTVKVPSYL